MISIDLHSESLLLCLQPQELEDDEDDYDDDGVQSEDLDDEDDEAGPSGLIPPLGPA